MTISLLEPVDNTMKCTVAAAIFALTALLAVHAMAADTVQIWPESGGIASFDAGEHKLSGTIIAVKCPPNMGIVC